MKLKINPSIEEWKSILTRPAFDAKSLRNKVQQILDDVALNGDDAIRKYTLQFDGVHINNFALTEKDFELAESRLSNELKQAIITASENITRFHSSQVSASQIVDIKPGIQCWQKKLGIEKVGLYIPGGTAPLFSTVLMLAIPAKIAGCKQIILCTPPSKNGKVHDAILFAAKIAGVTQIYTVGGVQAIAGMAYGTDSIPQVYKIFGPGNQYVNCAKQMVQLDGIAIDMPAGPSEVCVIADETANPAFIAADLISQAEHGIDSQVLLLTTTEEIVKQVEGCIQSQLSELPRKEIAEKVLSESYAVVLSDPAGLIKMSNEYAPEHLIICTKNTREVAEQVINAGSVFVGQYSPEAAGDYASGTNHTLPTNGMARAYSGVTVDSFCKTVSFQELTHEGLISISDTIVHMAEAEGLQAHANAIKIRM